VDYTLRSQWNVRLERAVRGRFSPLPAPFPLRDVHVSLHRFLPRQLYASLSSTRFSTRLLRFLLRSYALPITNHNLKTQGFASVTYKNSKRTKCRADFLINLSNLPPPFSSISALGNWVIVRSTIHKIRTLDWCCCYTVNTNFFKLLTH